jgi:hypothetical protein
MTQNELLLHLLKKLNKLKIIYMLTGAYSVSFHGQPRATHDIDLKLAIKMKDVDSFYESFKDGFYIDKGMIKDAIRHQTMFNIIHQESNIKIDFWISRDNAFDNSRLKRRQKDVFLGESVYIASPEDTILVKLDWFKKSQSEKHLQDALGVLKVSKEKLDFDYIECWAERLKIMDIWRKLKK